MYHLVRTSASRRFLFPPAPTFLLWRSDSAAWARTALSALGGEPSAAEKAEGVAIPIKAWLDLSAGPLCSWLVANARLRSQVLAGRGWATWISKPGSWAAKALQ
ncbi:hypothetical protein FHS02_002435 [Massilia umbonata]|uniref:Uncharacterized protein n=1 Tax=Pseudoduganella umbonata TaxID=864828 RepID=A0A7W5EB55_9BURK|nr:hypothetical protein [Pseudoduganella umbonata]